MWHASKNNTHKLHQRYFLKLLGVIQVFVVVFMCDTFQVIIHSLVCWFVFKTFFYQQCVTTRQETYKRTSHIYVHWLLFKYAPQVQVRTVCFDLLFTKHAFPLSLSYFPSLLFLLLLLFHYGIGSECTDYRIIIYLKNNVKEHSKDSEQKFVCSSRVYIKSKCFFQINNIQNGSFGGLPKEIYKTRMWNENLHESHF